VCASSRYCRAALEGPWEESKSRSIPLDDVEPSVFHVYTSWLYRARLPVRIDAPGLEGNAEYLMLARAYVLGDRLQDVAFCDACMDGMVVKAKMKSAPTNQWWVPVGPVVAYIYDNTTPNSKARRFLLDFYTHHGQSHWLERWADRDVDLPAEFLFDLAVQLLKRRPAPGRALFMNPCEYHDHEKKHPAC
jgi:hypothetical protein